MHPDSIERWVLERHLDMIKAAQRHSRLSPQTPFAVREWMAGRLRSMADRLDGAPLERQRPTA
jgi:hypothetical protein